MPGTDRPDTGWGFPDVQPYADPASPDELREVAAPPTDDTVAISTADLFGDPVEPAPPLAAAPAVRAPEEAPPEASDEALAASSFHVPRRLAVEPAPVSPLRALAGAVVAVAGVLLGIGALLWATDSPGGSPTVTANQAQTTPISSTAPSAQPTASFRAPAPLVAAPSPTPADTTPTPAAAPKLAVTVLNNSKVTGLADRAARRFRAGGWPIRDTGNFTGKVNATTVYYAPGQLASAERLQRSFTGLVRVRPRFATLPGTGLTVVLTRDYRG